MSEQAEWCFICGLVSALEERLMDERAIMAVFEAGSEEDLKTRLRASLLFADAPSSDRPADEVEERFAAFARAVGEVSPDGGIADLFLLEGSWRRFRGYAKRALAQRSETRSTRGEKDTDAASELFDALWSGRVEDPRMQFFADAATALASAEGDEDTAGMVDRILDAHECAALRTVAAALDGEMLYEWVAAFTRMRAGLAVFRAREMGWDAQRILAPWRTVGFDEPALVELASNRKDDWPAAWDRLGLPEAARAPEGDAAVWISRRIRRRMSALTEEAKGIPFGPEQVFAFLWSLREEATKLRVVLTAAACGMSEERVAEVIRT